MEKHFPRGKKKKKGFETFVRAVRISCDPRSRRVFHQLSRSKTSKIVSLCFGRRYLEVREKIKCLLRE